MRFLSGGLFLSLIVPACAGPSDDHAGGASSDLRELTAREALADLETVGELIGPQYGPLEYKKQRFGFDLEAALAEARGAVLAANTEADRIRPFYELLAKLKDGHVGLSFRVRADVAAEQRIGLNLTP